MIQIVSAETDCLLEIRPEYNCQLMTLKHRADWIEMNATVLCQVLNADWII